MRQLAAIILGATLAAMLAPASQAQVYKCSASGHSIYQDTPCKDAPTAAPYIAAPGPVNDLSSQKLATMTPVELRAKMVELKNARFRLESEYKHEFSQMRERLKNAPREQVNQAGLALSAQWDPQFSEAGDREAKLQAEMATRCSSATKFDPSTLTCH